MVGLQMRHLAPNVGCNEGYTVISLATTTRKRASSFLHPPIVQQLYGVQVLTYHAYRLLQMHALGQRSIIPYWKRITLKRMSFSQKGRVLKIGKERGSHRL